MKLHEIIEWIAYNSARTTDVEELAASDAVRLAAAITQRTPAWIAAEVSRELTRWSSRQFSRAKEGRPR